MKTLKKTLAVAIAMLTVTSFAAGPDWPPAPWTRTEKKPAEGETVRLAIACKDCKTVNEATDAKAGAKFFDKDATHDCAGCKGKITVRQVGTGKGPLEVRTTHECTKCGPTSAMTCASHVKK